MAAPGAVAPRPLRGKSFYLDLPAGRSARELAEAIGRLGGVTESFLSKEVSYVVSSNKEAKRDKAGTRTEKQSNVTSEDAKTRSPTPSTSKVNHSRPQQKPPDTALISRGKELLQKAMKNQDTGGGSSILASARLWGVQILHVDQMLSYTRQLLRAISGARKRCQQTEAKCPESGSKVHKGKLKPPFLKVEDQSRQFRPFHHQFKTFPDLNFQTPKSSSPFEPPKSHSNSCRTRAAEGCPTRSEGEKSPRSTPVTVPKKKRGFCECCQETFEELHKHLQSPQHRRFALDDSQYAPVDRVIAQLSNGFVEQSDKVPRSCLADEHLVPQAQGTGRIEMLGKEKQQPEHGAVEPFIGTERDHGLKTEGRCPRLPGDGVSNPSAGAGLWDRAVGPPQGVCGTVDEAAVGDTDLGLAPGPGWGTCIAGEASASSSQSDKQQTLGSIDRPLPVWRKRRLSRWSSQGGKKPRLELGGGLYPDRHPSPVDGATGTQGVGQASEPGWPAAGAGGRSPSTELCNGARSSLGLELSPRGSPEDPAPVSAGSAVAAGAGSERGWIGANVSSQRKQLGGENENAPRNENSPDPGSAVSQTSCPTGQLPSPEPPVAGGRCCCSPCVRAAEKIAPGAADLAGHSAEHPGLPPGNARADLGSSSSSESDWDVQLLSTLTGVRDSRTQPVDRDLLQRTHVSVRDSGYESQLCSVLKQKSELAWAGKEDKNCRNCCVETKGASFPIFETFLGSWTS
ncbi:protein DBF4 homolog B isoform X2 [Patagioenas fasciata]|uniref:protein DBF4 homolog B isoform X2 n=1 Tax=Patagioenas fasciata TaxID=372321 RepID=UPI003A99E3D7